MLKRKIAFSFVILGLIVSSLPLLRKPPAYAAEINFRSVATSTAVPSAQANETFNFTLPSTNTVGSMVYEYCSNSPLFIFSCTPPTGLDVTAASLASQTGNVGFSVDSADTTANKLVITRPAAAGAAVASSYKFSNVINPSGAGQTVFVRISTYATTDGSGSRTDQGAVAFATLNTFSVDAFVPPFLRLCVGITVAPDCSSTNGDSIDLGNLSSRRANFASSQFAAATNSTSGYIIYSLGSTMTSGNNVIAALNSPGGSSPGSAQFGINLRANLAPPVGQNPVGLGTASPAPNYNIPNRFMYSDGDSIADSNINTNYERMTVSYLVNITSKQPPGVYATTITYLALAQF